MDVKFWVCDVHTGVVVDRLRVAGGWTLTNRFGGGSASFSVPLGHLRNPVTNDWDWASIQRVHDLLAPGDYSVLATRGGVALGEWVITRTQPSSDGDQVEVAGEEWEMYFGERSVSNLSRGTRTADMYDLARLVFERTFVTAKVVPIAMNVPATMAGVSKTIETPEPRSETYADLMRTVTESTPVMEYRIESGVEWDGEAAVRAVRDARFGRPVLARASSFRAVLPEWGARSGNVLEVSAGKNWRNWSYQVAAIGAGDGDKRLLARAERTYAEYPQTLHRGVISQHTDVERKALLQSLADGELDALSASMDEPFDVTLNPARVESIPRVGEQIRLVVEPRPTFPGGVDTDLRVGEVTLSGTSDLLESISMKAA